MTNDAPDPNPSPGTSTPPAVPAMPPVVPAQHPYGNRALHPPLTLPQGIAPPNAEETNMGMLIHLLAIFTGWLVPLILWLVRKDQSPFIDHHGKEALNFQITYAIIAVCGMVLIFVTLGFGAIIILPLLLVMGILALVWEIQACIAASRGEWHYYPFSFRFVR